MSVVAFAFDGYEARIGMECLTAVGKKRADVFILSYLHDGALRNGRQFGKADHFQNSRAPFGTLLSMEQRTTLCWSSGKPVTNTSDLKLAIWRGGKFTTQTTCRPIRSTGR